MPMSSPQMTRMFGLSPSLTAAAPPARTRILRPSAAGKYSGPDGEPASPRPGDLAGDQRSITLPSIPEDPICQRPLLLPSEPAPHSGPLDSTNPGIER